MGMNDRHGIEAWLAMGDGSPEQEQAIDEAVMEMVSLVHLGIDALCRHLPEQESAIRRVIQHLASHPECLEGRPCVGVVGASSNREATYPAPREGVMLAV